MDGLKVYTGEHENEGQQLKFGFTAAAPTTVPTKNPFPNESYPFFFDPAMFDDDDTGKSKIGDNPAADPASDINTVLEHSDNAPSVLDDLTDTRGAPSVGSKFSATKPQCRYSAQLSSATISFRLHCDNVNLAAAVPVIHICPFDPGPSPPTHVHSSQVHSFLNCMISVFAKNGRISDARQLFDNFPQRNLVSWNTMIVAWQLFEKVPNPNSVSWVTMLSGFSKHGKITEARRLFVGIPNNNVVSWNAMIATYAQDLQIGEAIKLLMKIPNKDCVSWTTIIDGDIRVGKLDEAQEVYNQIPCT